jgi:hypothetical protein
VRTDPAARDAFEESAAHDAIQNFHRGGFVVGIAIVALLLAGCAPTIVRANTQAEDVLDEAGIKTYGVFFRVRKPPRS